VPNARHLAVDRANLQTVACDRINIVGEHPLRRICSNRVVFLHMGSVGRHRWGLGIFADCERVAGIAAVARQVCPRRRPGPTAPDLNRCRLDHPCRRRERRRVVRGINLRDRAQRAARNE
jgi:hypothetical protein